MNGNSMQVTIVKYDTDTRPKGNITQTAKSTPTGRNLQAASSSTNSTSKNDTTRRTGSGLV